ncbi:galactoside 2-alpha-L-fucosyltransferase-like [Panicum miliaceum]|uniref:Fucosyltransferase n=1 Tax=Panicum miliaceum TaxID=4540 RepID=A0A3L6PYC3_PANMI|nr:galactoside 2-alpha-L-fucosyltransferase-like [Panicum miliaceum]
MAVHARQLISGGPEAESWQHGARSQLAGRNRSSAVRPTTVLLTSAIVAAVLLMAAVLFGARWTPSSDAGTWVSAGVRVAMNAVSDQGAVPLATVPDPSDRLLGGLLSSDFDDRSCLSRYRPARYRRASLHALSPHLVSALRRYESLHRLCGPGTPAYARAVERLRAPPKASSGDDVDPSCSYLVWTPNAGLGNRILSITAGFLYALLTDRVLLLDGSRGDLDDLFCEPFPGSTWILPRGDLPARVKLTIDTPESLGNTLGRGEAPGGGAPWLYAHLVHNYDAQDKLFFCDDVQAQLRRVPWLVFQADNYFVPGLFLMPRFERELARMFPRRDAVFHHLGRYLFHPSNTVWGMVARYHGAYFAKADERVGIQVRTFKWAPISTDEFYAQILKCTHRENILPAVVAPAANTSRAAKRKAVVVVSLHGEYSEMLRNLYHEHGTAAGEAVSVFQPTHLGEQHIGDKQQNQKALAEMVLLIFSDVVVTSGVSTFGPPNYDCRAKARCDTGRMVQHIRHCEDFPEGVQLLES